MLDVDQQEIEGLALELYREAGEDPCRPPSSLVLATRHPRIDEVVLAPLERPGVFELTAPRRGRIRLSKRLSPWGRRYFCAHELGEFGLETLRHPYRSYDRERRAHQLGSALLMPAPAVRVHLRDHSFDVDGMAARFRVSPVCAFLRWAEVTERSVAVIGALFVPRRGRHQLPADDELRRLVVQHHHGEVNTRYRFVTLLDGPDPARVGVIWEGV